jgi:hypothetical protein
MSEEIVNPVPIFLTSNVLLGDVFKLAAAARSCPFWLGYVWQCCVKFLGNVYHAIFYSAVILKPRTKVFMRPTMSITPF